MRTTTKILTLIFFLVAMTMSASAQVFAPTGITTRASSQLVYYYDTTFQESPPGSTDVQVTNTNPTEGVYVHVQIFRSFNAEPPGEPPVLTVCDERNFVDFLTPNDTHVYDLSADNFDKNEGENAAESGENTSIVDPPQGSKGFVVITPVVSEADLTGISFQHLTGNSNDDTRQFIINAMGRDAVNFTTGEIVPDGTPLDGSTNGYLLLQPEELLFNFENIASVNNGPTDRDYNVDIVGFVFTDQYGEAGLQGYTVNPGEVDWTPFIFDWKEDPTSCSTRTVSCFETSGLNDSIGHSNFDYNGENLLCGGSNSSQQQEILEEDGEDILVGWTRIFVSGVDEFENHVGVYYSEYQGGADFMYVRGERTEIDPGPVDEVCDDEEMADEDEDGFANCLDTDCATAENCENGVDQCTNGTDDDEDGATDCADLGCDGTVIDSESGAACETGGETSCNDGFDNDGDGDVDSADSDCQAADTGSTGSDGDGGGCNVAGTVTTATAAANFLLPLLPLAGAYGYRRIRKKVLRS